MIEYLRRGIAISVAVSALLVATGAVAASCPSFPQVPWWEDVSHESVSRKVERKFGGDWQGYADAWDRQLVKLQEIQLKGSAAVIRSKAAPGGKVTLSGPKLDSYVDTVRRRVEITRCLGRNAGALRR